FIPERRLRHVQVEVEEDVVLVAPEQLVRLHVDRQVEVAARPALRPDLAFARQPDLRTMVDARRHLHRQRALALLAAGAAAVAARRVYDAPLAPAPVTHGHVHELPEDALLRAADLAAAVALRAAFRLRPGLGPQPVADGAQLRGRHVELLLRAEDRLLERQRDGAPDVGPPHGPALRARSRPSEEGVEDVAEPAEAEALEPAGEGVLAALRRRVPEAVVHRPPLGVGEDLVGLVDLLEARLGPRLLVSVRVVLHRQAPERLFDLVRSRVPRDAEHVVVVLLAVGCHLILYRSESMRAEAVTSL